MKALLPLMLVWALVPFGVRAHPGSGIVVDSQGNVFVSDINRGLLKFSPDGKVTVVLKEAGHWLALDADAKFAQMEFEKSQHWPRWFKHRNPPGAGLALVSHYILGPFGEDSDLRRWGLKLAERGGKNVKKRAIVAVARKLAVLLHRLWVSGEVYEPLHNSQREVQAVA